MKTLFFISLFFQVMVSEITFVIEFKKDNDFLKNTDSVAKILKSADVEVLGEPKSMLKSIEEPIVEINFIPGVCQAGWYWENKKCNRCPCNSTVSNVTTIRFFSLI